ncbi:hypothetical protein NPIL_405171 [Nephila pilipes]|uniref:Uncharacterized protein n=1 Tax=Nephila pilipes TaxID=299642 RepID=A0A8X6PPS4_NEPPI|nr:hypothetical protein NPIL_405171 [Nephila pilipes]
MAESRNISLDYLKGFDNSFNQDNPPHECDVDVETGIVRPQLWNTPSRDNAASWFEAKSNTIIVTSSSYSGHYDVPTIRGGRARAGDIFLPSEGIQRPLSAG